MNTGKLKWLQSFADQQRYLRGILDSPILQFAKDFERQHKLIGLNNMLTLQNDLSKVLGSTAAGFLDKMNNTQKALGQAVHLNLSHSIIDSQKMLGHVLQTSLSDVTGSLSSLESQQMGKAFEGIQQSLDGLNAIANSIKPLENIANSQKQMLDNIQSQLDISKILGGFNVAKRMGDLDRIASEFYDALENQDIESIDEDITPELTTQDQDIIEELLSSLRKITDPEILLERLAQAIIQRLPVLPPTGIKHHFISVFINVLSGIIVLYYGLHTGISTNATSPTPKANKVLIKTIKKLERVGVVLPQNIRIVTADVLIVRERPSRKSENRGRLMAGEVVQVLRWKKKKRWALVELHNPNTDIKIRGWVFARYLKK